ncbi:MAG TPA: hypothetical protein VMW56_20945 [Candidatus Margulisiibacteriota bacterium]|nr:hypothetical protein [Candidatus Margulisiibacteriota bacterium]
MSKPNRDSQLRLGEQRLHEWGLPADAGRDALRGVMGREAPADLAIAARLGAHADPASVALLQALEATSTDKLVRKEIKRSLYRLEQRGVPIPSAPAPPPAPVIAAPALEGYLSAVDGRGDQLVWLTKPHPGGLAHLFAVINDPEGLREVNLFETTRKALRASCEELLRKHELRMIEADWRYCDFLIDRAFRWAAAHGQAGGGDYPGMRAKLIKAPVSEMQPLIFAHVDVAAVRSNPQVLAASAELLEEKEFRTWFFDQETLKPYLDEAQRIKDSPLLLNPAQQQERFRALTERAIEELFGGARRLSWVRRFEEMAYFFHATARSEAALQALAAALALDASAHGGRDIPVCEQLARASLFAFLQVEEQREQEEVRSSLVLTPQQAAREMQQRRRP